MAMFGFLRRLERAPARAASDAPAGPGATTSTSSEGSSEALMHRLDWTVIRRLDGIFQGDHETLFHGAGMRMSDIREYQTGDDVRRLDWNVTARTGTLHVRTFHEERELTAWFLVDGSASLAFASRGPAKRVVARQVTGALAGLLVRHGDRIAAMFDDGRGESPARLLPPGGGRSHVVRMLSLFDAQAAAATGKARSPENREGTRLVPLLARAGAVIRRRSLVVLVSDFLAAPGWETELRRLAQRHEVLCVRIQDPVESELPNVGFITVEDSESGEQCLLDTSDPVVRSRYAAIVRDREAALRTACDSAGADLLTLRTDAALLQQFTAHLALRRRRRALPAGGRAAPRSRPAAPAAQGVMR
jgi:uncharacterized protein (DUF58 family)